MTETAVEKNIVVALAGAPNAGKSTAPVSEAAGSIEVC
jgi:uridine kinase